MTSGEKSSFATWHERLPDAARKALELLSQPTPLVDCHTDYERQSTPFFVDAWASSSDPVRVVVWLDNRYGSYMGDYDNWHHSIAYALPAEWFFDALARLQAGGEISAQTRAEMIKEDEAWGSDCEHPYSDVTRQEVQIMLRLELSADMKAVTLTLLEPRGGGWEPLTQLRQTA
ncbi:MAG: hypothetical protein WC378_00475 [Opitutaceae bacterium]|jgi:hypothetical protein